MASRAINPRNPSGRKTDAEWRAGLRRSLRRIVQMAGAGILLGAMTFLALALISYTQTDPSPSTAAAPDQVANWMGASGAWVADRVLLVFGLTGVLLLPLLYVSARKLWRDVE
ncbi:MAG: DNA translocase FtsK 4TM domain-containing protein, partial [Erythrobacter sp.]|nr:DNA translocase FtsK 4TM domain-containing protein [Erythrobacter sp.]